MGLWNEPPRSRIGIWVLAAAPWVLAAPMIAFHDQFESEPAQFVVSLLLMLPPFILLGYFGASSDRASSRFFDPSDAHKWATVVGAFFGLPMVAFAIGGMWTLATLTGFGGILWGSVALTRRDIGSRPRRRVLQAPSGRPAPAQHKRSAPTGDS